VTASKIDPERLAALLDGRLDASARAELLAQLDKSPDMLEVYADAVAVSRELAETHTQPRPTAIRRRWRSFGPRTWLAIAAILLVFVAAPIVRRWTTQTNARDSYQIASSVTATRAPLPQDWNATPWSTTRSSEEQLSPIARAARLGARLTDYVSMSQLGDSAAASVAFDIAALLDAIPAGSATAATFRSFADSRTRPAASDLARAVAAAEELAGPEVTRLGAWIEGIRIAAATRDAAMLQRFGATSVLPTLPPNVRDALDTLVRLIETTPSDLASIQAAATATLGVLASSR
jgi:hypothetical protein